MKKNLKLYLSGIPIGLINGFFGSGGGIAAVFVLEKLLGKDPKRAHATAVAIILPLSAAALFVYRRSLEDNWGTLIFCALGGVLGGILGAAVLKKMPSKWLRVLFGVIMIITAVRMVMG